MWTLRGNLFISLNFRNFRNSKGCCHQILIVCYFYPHMSILHQGCRFRNLQQVDDAPDTKTGTERDNEGLKNGDCLFKMPYSLLARNLIKK